MTNSGSEPRGCLAFLFGFGGGSVAGPGAGVGPAGSEEGNYHSGLGGYEGMGYADGGYAADYRDEQDDDEHR